MIIILISIIIGVVISGKSFYYSLDELLDYVFFGITIIFGGIVGCFIGVIPALMLPADIEINTYENKIESLQDNNSVGGDFFLGCGAVQGEMKYVFYYSIDGGFKMSQLSYEDVLIKYSNEARVIEYREEPTESFINWFALDITGSTYEIYVPKGTIKNNYNLDTQ